MKLQLKSWFKKPAKTATPLTAADIAAKVTEAERDLAEARTLVDTARAKLSEQRTEESLQGVRDAKEAEDDVNEMLTVLRADHVAAVQREAAAAHAELERQCADLGAQLTPAAIREAIEGDVEAEAAEILALAVRRKKRLDNAARFREMHHEHAKLLFKLGQIPDLSSALSRNEPVDLVLGPEPVIARVGALVRASPHDSATLRAQTQPLLPTYMLQPRRG